MHMPRTDLHPGRRSFHCCPAKFPGCNPYFPVSQVFSHRACQQCSHHLTSHNLPQNTLRICLDCRHHISHINSREISLNKWPKTHFLGEKSHTDLTYLKTHKYHWTLTSKASAAAHTHCTCKEAHTRDLHWLWQRKYDPHRKCCYSYQMAPSPSQHAKARKVKQGCNCLSFLLRDRVPH